MAPTLTPPLNPSSLVQNAVGQVVISGSGFNQTSQAYFGGTPSQQTVYNTASQVTATVPPAVTSVPGTYLVTVVNNDTGEVSNPLTFTVTAAAGARPVAPPGAGSGFGIVSSIQFKNTPFYTLFKLGTGRPDLLNDNNIIDNVGYEQGNLSTAINTVGTNVAILVTFGGNVAAAAAAQYSQRPYLSVIGNLTPDLYGTRGYTLMGGVNLDTVVRNADRFNYLNQELNIPASQICLLSNPLSRMAYDEQAQWLQIYQAGRIIPAKVIVGDAGAAVKAINDAFDIFKNDGTLTTMIVSADPAFQAMKQALIIAANNSGKQVSYPLQTYSNLQGTARPAPGRYWLHGPKLARACLQLGRDAMTVLQNNTALDLRVPPLELNAPNDQS